MPVRDSEAIILRHYPLGEADRLVSFLSRKAGRMRGVARGAKRPKSVFGSTLEPLSYVRIWWYEKETLELVRLRQCDLIESFLDLQQEYSTGLALGLLSEVCEVVLPEREASDPPFRLLLVALRRIRETRDAWVPALYFLLWTVRLAGWLPDLARCGRCARELTGQRAFVSAMRSVVTCEACHRPGGRALTAESMTLAQQMLREPLAAIAPAPEDGQPARDLREYLLDVIEHQAEKKLKTRKMLDTK